MNEDLNPLGNFGKELLKDSRPMNTWEAKAANKALFEEFGMKDIRTAVICADGIGGSILGQQCAHFAKQSGEEVTIFYAADNAKFRPIKYLFPNTIQLPEYFQQNNDFEKDKGLEEELVGKYGGFDNIYYVVPDLLFNNRHGFDYKKYDVSLPVVKGTRLLTHLSKPSNIVYCALNTTTKGYDYHNVPKLIRLLGEFLPDKEIYVPTVPNWAGHNIANPFGDEKYSDNVLFHSNPDILESIEKLKKSEYCICLDNGISHIAFHLGVPRLLLDPRCGQLPWISRWRQTEEESVDISISPEQIFNIVKLNLMLPQTQLIDRKYILSNPLANWRQVLLMKTV